MNQCRGGKSNVLRAISDPLHQLHFGLTSAHIIVDAHKRHTFLRRVCKQLSIVPSRDPTIVAVPPFPIAPNHCGIKTRVQTAKVMRDRVQIVQIGEVGEGVSPIRPCCAAISL